MKMPDFFFFFFSLNNNNKTPEEKKKRQISGFFQTFLVLSKTKQGLRGCAACHPSVPVPLQLLIEFPWKAPARVLLVAETQTVLWAFSVVFLIFFFFPSAPPCSGRALRSLQRDGHRQRPPGLRGLVRDGATSVAPGAAPSRVPPQGAVLGLYWWKWAVA